ncbi:protein BatD [Pseudomonas protegens]|uniref:BatD family protein n=1 Tax=Pseudomonas protegens TaxID=380021 RepID=UPI000C9ABF8D|nr:BatD family protein [Pseudomonas protegens]PNG37749.1 protein BatD [Pseudomonas protegens]
MTRCTALLLALALWTSASQAAGLLASLDRNQVNSGETVELTLESTDVTQFGKPDLTSLDSQFEVRGTRQVNQLNSLGDSHASTRWIVTLLPRHTGTLEIAPLQLGNLQSQALTLQVNASPVQDQDSRLEPVFINAELNQPKVYVQAQALLTLHIYHSVPLFDDSSLSPLQLSDARIEQLGEPRTYEKLINGVRHGVIEMRYAVYPQRSGELLIPALTFTATPANPGTGTEEPTSQAPKPGKLIHVSSAELSLQVLAKPAAYPADAPWLPARSLTLSESWSPEPDHPQVGDSLTRSLTLSAEGLSSAQLPPLPQAEINGLRSYPDQPQLSNQHIEHGLLGTREERQALVPTRTGDLELPALEITWWNTLEDRLEQTSLPARTLQVANNPSLVVDTPAGTPQASVDNSDLWLWQLSTLLLACTTLLGFGLWWRARSQPAVLRAAQTGPSPRSLLDDLKRACQANDPQTTRQALDAWARQQPETLADMAARFIPLSDALDGLNGALYSETGQYWQGEELWRAIRAIPINERVQDPVADTTSLPPLYPK